VAVAGGSAIANVANVGDVGGSEIVEEMAVSHHVEAQEVDGGRVPSVADVAASKFAGVMPIDGGGLVAVEVVDLEVGGKYRIPKKKVVELLGLTFICSHELGYLLHFFLFIGGGQTTSLSETSPSASSSSAPFSSSASASLELLLSEQSSSSSSAPSSSTSLLSESSSDHHWHLLHTHFCQFMNLWIDALVDN
jgi:hypothetical protein